METLTDQLVSLHLVRNMLMVKNIKPTPTHCYTESSQGIASLSDGERSMHEYKKAAAG